MGRLSRLLNPQSIAVVGGGAWCESIIQAATKIGFAGTITPIHPAGKVIAGIQSIQSLTLLETPPDATFIGVNRNATIDIVQQLRESGAGGAICFASGFAEAQAELADGDDLQSRLLAAARDMPILGPNCYGFVNALDGAAVWPDQHGCKPVKSGVAILTQSSNIAINLTMQQRALPIGYMVTCGNQAQMGQAEIASELLDDPRVTTIGLHIEGFKNLRDWEAFAAKAAALGKPVVGLKVGTSDQAQAATISHTASLAGSDAGADALFRRLGFIRVKSLAVFLETLKFLHVNGPIPRGALASISCSGGEASLAADLGKAAGLTFPPLNTQQRNTLGMALGPKVALANPLDYHTYIWRDTDAMAKAWTAIDDPEIDATMTIVDYPRPDTCDAGDWECATHAAIRTRQTTGKPTLLVTSLPELLPEPIAKQLLAHGVTPMHGLHDAIEAIAACSQPTNIDTNPLHLAPTATKTAILSEVDAKNDLRKFGLDTPSNAERTSINHLLETAAKMNFPVVLKGTGSAHKTEHGLVALNLRDVESVKSAATSMNTETFLVEEMVTDTLVELLVGITKDAAHGYVLTIGAGGVLTEILSDTATLLVPSREVDVKDALNTLRISPLLRGYRGKPAINVPSVIKAIMALQAYVIANGGDVEEVEVNPLICTQKRAIAVDALIRKA